MPLKSHIPDKPLPANTARELDTLVYLCNRENVKSTFNVDQRQIYLLFDRFNILKSGWSDRLLLSKMAR